MQAAKKSRTDEQMMQNTFSWPSRDSTVSVDCEKQSTSVLRTVQKFADGISHLFWKLCVLITELLDPGSETNGWQVPLAVFSLFVWTLTVSECLISFLVRYTLTSTVKIFALLHYSKTHLPPVNSMFCPLLMLHNVIAYNFCADLHS